jgi:hypothetical protein
MDDTQRDRRVMDDSAETTPADSHTTEASARTVARLLANPRRVRRD